MKFLLLVLALLSFKATASELDCTRFKWMENKEACQAMWDKWNTSPKHDYQASTDARKKEQRRIEELKRKEQERLSKLPGVQIGMTTKQVLEQTSWGKPNRTNRTTTAHGTSEQWVYGNSNYLYFRNGILSAIQN